jgi:hypothetical protein
VQLEGEGVEPAGQHPVAAGEGVVGHHGGDGHGQADAGHDQGLAHRAGHLVQAARAAAADGQQRVVDAPDRAEEADEGGGGAHRGQRGQAGLQAGGLLVQHLLDGAGDELAGAAGLGQLGRAMAGVVGLGMQGMGRQVREGVARAVGLQFGAHLVERAGVPELVQEGAAAAGAQGLGHALGHDDGPGGDGHAHQQHQQGVAHRIALGDEVADAGGGRGREGGGGGVHGVFGRRQGVIRDGGGGSLELEGQRGDGHRLDGLAIDAVGLEAGGAHGVQRGLVQAGWPLDWCSVTSRGRPFTSTTTRTRAVPVSPRRRAAAG